MSNRNPNLENDISYVQQTINVVAEKLGMTKSNCATNGVKKCDLDDGKLTLTIDIQNNDGDVVVEIYALDNSWDVYSVAYRVIYIELGQRDLENTLVNLVNYLRGLPMPTAAKTE